MKKKIKAKQKRQNWKLMYEMLLEKYRSITGYTGAVSCRRCGFPRHPGHICQECGWDNSYIPTDKDTLDYFKLRSKKDSSNAKLWRARLKQFKQERGL